jgi:hypothetical protein
MTIDSSDVTFSHLFPGSKARTMQEKASADVPVSLDDADETDDYSRAMWAWEAVDGAGGGRILFPPRVITFGQQVEYDRTGAYNLEILGHGAQLKTTDYISALKIVESNESYTTRVVGLNVNDNNGHAKAGFEQERTTNVTWESCSVLTNGDDLYLAENATYAAWHLHQSDPEVQSTGCFWTRWPGCKVKRTGTHFLPKAVLLEGACNASDFSGFQMGGVVDGIVLENPSGALDYLSNGVSVVDCWIESITGSAVRLIGAQGQRVPSGIVVRPFRAETIGTLLSIEGCTLDAFEVPQIILSHVDSDVTTLVNNPNHLLYELQHASLTREELAHRISNNGFEFEDYNGDAHVLAAIAQSTGRGISLYRRNADSTRTKTELAGLKYAASGIVDLVGNWASGFLVHLRHIGGISGNNTRMMNVGGTVTTNGSGVGQVTFARQESDASYCPMACALDVTPRQAACEYRTVDGFKVYGQANTVYVWWAFRPSQ